MLVDLSHTDGDCSNSELLTPATLIRAASLFGIDLMVSSAIYQIARALLTEGRVFANKSGIPASYSETLSAIYSAHSQLSFSSEL